MPPCSATASASAAPRSRSSHARARSTMLPTPPAGWRAGPGAARRERVSYRSRGVTVLARALVFAALGALLLRVAHAEEGPGSRALGTLLRAPALRGARVGVAV